MADRTEFVGGLSPHLHRTPLYSVIIIVVAADIANCSHCLLHRFATGNQFVNKKLNYRKETVRLLHNIEIRVLH